MPAKRSPNLRPGGDNHVRTERGHCVEGALRLLVGEPSPMAAFKHHLKRLRAQELKVCIR